MNVEQIEVARGLFVAFAVLLWFYGPWQALLVEWARQGVLELRDDWFDATVLGGPQCKPAEARTVLHTCDAVTESMELLSLPGILTMNLWLRADPRAGSRRSLSAEVYAIADQALQRLALQTVDRAGHYVAAQTFARSLFTFPYGLFLIIQAELLRNSAVGSRSSIRGNWRSTQDRPANIRGSIIRRELEIAAAVSNDPFVRLYFRRALLAHGGR